MRRIPLASNRLQAGASGGNRGPIPASRSDAASKVVSWSRPESAPPRGVVLPSVVGEIHGDEEAEGHRPPSCARLKVLRLAVTVWTVRHGVNPDGHEAGRRVNARGGRPEPELPGRLGRVRATGKPGYYGGKAPLSEPESRALKRLIERIDPDVSIYYHEPWGAVLLPCGGPAPEQRAVRADLPPTPGPMPRSALSPGTVTRWQRGASRHRVRRRSSRPVRSAGPR